MKQNIICVVVIIVAWEECIVLSHYIEDEDCVNGIIVILHQSHILGLISSEQRRYLPSESSQPWKYQICWREMMNVLDCLGREGKSNKLIAY